VFEVNLQKLLLNQAEVLPAILKTHDGTIFYMYFKVFDFWDIQPTGQTLLTVLLSSLKDHSLMDVKSF